MRPSLRSARIFISVVAHERFGEGHDHTQRVCCAADLQSCETWTAPIVKELLWRPPRPAPSRARHQRLSTDRLPPKFKPANKPPALEIAATVGIKASPVAWH